MTAKKTPAIPEVPSESALEGPTVDETLAEAVADDEPAEVEMVLVRYHGPSGEFIDSNGDLHLLSGGDAVAMPRVQYEHLSNVFASHAFSLVEAPAE